MELRKREKEQDVSEKKRFVKPNRYYDTLLTTINDSNVMTSTYGLGLGGGMFLAAAVTDLEVTLVVLTMVVLTLGVVAVTEDSENYGILPRVVRLLIHGILDRMSTRMYCFYQSPLEINQHGCL